MGDIEVVVEEGQGTKGHVELGDDLGDGTDDEGVGKQAGFAAVEIGKEESAGDDIEHERYYVVGSRDNGIGKLRLGQRRSGGAKVNNAVGDGAKDQTEHEHESNIAAEFGRFIGGALQQEYADAGDENEGVEKAANGPGKRDEIAVVGHGLNEAVGGQSVEGVHGPGAKQCHADDKGSDIAFDIKIAEGQ